MHTNINFQKHQVIHQLSLVWFWLHCLLSFFLGPDFWSLPSSCYSMRVESFTGHPLPIPSFLHPNSVVGCLFPGSWFFLCFVLHHRFTGQHPTAIQRKRMWEVNCLGACKSEKVFCLHIWLIVWLCGNTERRFLSGYLRCCFRVLLWYLISPTFHLCLFILSSRKFCQ